MKLVYISYLQHDYSRSSVHFDYLSKNNPFDFDTVKKNIEQALTPYKNRIKITLMPNITNICYGRGVGYKIEEIVLPENIQMK